MSHRRPSPSREGAAAGSLFDDDGGSLFGDAEERSERAPGRRGEVRGRGPARRGQAGRLPVRRRASLFDTPVEDEQPTPAATAAVGSTIPEGTSLFDVGDAEPEPAQAEPTPTPEVGARPRQRDPRGHLALRPRRPGADAPAPVAAPAAERPTGRSATTSPRGSPSSTSTLPTTPRPSSTPTTTSRSRWSSRSRRPAARPTPRGPTPTSTRAGPCSTCDTALTWANTLDIT